MDLAGRRVKHSPYNVPVRALKLESRHVVENCIAPYQAITGKNQYTQCLSAAGLQQLDGEALSDNGPFFAACNQSGRNGDGSGNGWPIPGLRRHFLPHRFECIVLKSLPEHSKSLQANTQANPIYRPPSQIRKLAPSRVRERAFGRSVDPRVYASNLNRGSTEIATGERRWLRDDE